MAFAEFYLPLKAAHISLAATSGTLFAARGAAVLAGQAWPMARPWRLASMAIDTLLLAAGATLWVLLALNPLQQHWLGVKLLLLVAYIGLGTLALKRARSRGARMACYVAALALFLFIVGVARHHHPLGVLA